MKVNSRSVEVAYVVIGIIFAAFLLFVMFGFEDEVYEARPDLGASICQDYETEWVEDTDLPQNGYNRITLQLDRIEEISQVVSFYVSHQNTYAYIGDELVYSLEPSKANFFGKTTGNNWAYIFLKESDEGKVLTIELHPAYTTSVRKYPTIYMGSRWGIFRSVLRGEIFPIILAIIELVFGITFLIVSLYARRYGGLENHFVYLGTFALVLGIWKITDLQCTCYIIPYSIGLSMLCLTTLFFMPIPFVLFVKELFKRSANALYYHLCGASLILCLMTIGLQSFNIVDIREMLPFDHILMLAVVVTCLVHAIVDISLNGWNTQIILATGAMVACSLGLVLDIVIFYNKGGSVSANFALLGFVIYTLVLGIQMFQELVYFLERGKRAKKYADLAMLDAMTGMMSRNAYMERLSEKPKSNARITVVMFDLNNLKYYNDTYGHEEGDRYLIRSAESIRYFFEELGNCYRIGGDEFCVIMEDVPLAKCQEAMVSLKKKGEVENISQGNAFPFYIAMGAAQYDPEEDMDLHGTVRRADRAMYRDKISSKEVGNASGKI